MKILFLRDPNQNIEIIEASLEAQEKYGTRYGADTIILSREHLQALLDGKMLAWNDSEYSTFVVLEKEPNDG